MAKWVLSSIVGTVILLSLAGVTLYNSDYKYLLASLPDKEVFILEYDTNDKIEVVTRSDYCDYVVFRITKDETTAKCGYRNIVTSKWYLEYFKTYGDNEWVRLPRQASKITIDVSQTDDGYTVKRTTPYYATTSRSGTAGTLTETFEISKDRMKSSLNFDTSYSTREWRAVYSTDPNVEVLEETQVNMVLDKNLNINFNDKLFDYRADKETYYKPQPGNFEIDPLFQFGNQTGVSIGSGALRFGYCDGCSNGNNVSFTSSESGLSATYESGWLWSKNLSELNNMTALCRSAAGAGSCEFSVRNGSNIVPQNNSNVVTRCLFNGNMDCIERAFISSGLTFDGGAINGMDAPIFDGSDVAYLHVNNSRQAGNGQKESANYTINFTEGMIEMMVAFQ